MTKLLSIIIPTYKGNPKYLNELFFQLENLEPDKIEIIVIDDGNKEPTIINILNAFSTKFTILHNFTNMGVSYSRNLGIQKSKSKFILFVDSDDFIDTRILLNSIKILQDNDVYFFKIAYTRIRQNLVSIENVEFIPAIENLDKLFCYDFRNDMPFNEYLFKSSCSKIFKKEFLINNNIYFDESLSRSEDELFMAEIVSSKPSTTFINNTLYYYYCNNKSASRSYSDKYIHNAELFDKTYKNKFKQNKMLMKSYYLEIITIFIRTHTIIATKGLHLKNAFQYLKASWIKEGFRFLENDALVSNEYYKKLSKNILNNNYIKAYLLIIINYMKIKFLKS